MTIDIQPDTDTIRELNDTARQTLTGCKVLVTPGVQALAGFTELVHKVRTFTAFSGDTDPHGEHDFGSFQHEGETVYWKFDYHDLTMEYGSEDPSDSSITSRVLTIMLSSEY